MRRAAPILATAALFLLPLAFMDARTYVTLTVAGLAMGMLIFLVAAGLTLIFGLMDVLNFAHGALFSWGAYVGFSVALLLNQRWGWAAAPSVPLNVLLLAASILAAMVVAVGLGILLERVIVRPVYGRHMFQILITLGATIVIEELIRMIWGPNDQVMPVPLTFQGSWDVADVIVLRFPVVAIVLGVLVYLGITLLLTRTRVGLIVRAGVENGEMIQVLGHNIYRYFTRVFAAGSALAALGGVMWAMFSQSVRPAMGGEQLIFAFIVVIIGGLGSVTGSLLGALIVGLSYNYVAFLVPKAAIGINMAIMVLILLLRPTGLFGAGK
ncbi:MAG: inner-membrane translocator, branched-chain amino acid transport system permease protein [Candidatus Rokubacteria bacterium CSP1-6]|nr:MAG: inner-membrane translocator, branched-chain amino acid transport system permease protein [Candidatus Rokubacteria bacterium CSP1-6]